MDSDTVYAVGRVIMAVLIVLMMAAGIYVYGPQVLDVGTVLPNVMFIVFVLLGITNYYQNRLYKQEVQQLQKDVAELKRQVAEFQRKRRG